MQFKSIYAFAFAATAMLGAATMSTSCTDENEGSRSTTTNTNNGNTTNTETITTNEPITKAVVGNYTVNNVIDVVGVSGLGVKEGQTIVISDYTGENDADGLVNITLPAYDLNVEVNGSPMKSVSVKDMVIRGVKVVAGTDGSYQFSGGKVDKTEMSMNGAPFTAYDITTDSFSAALSADKSFSGSLSYKPGRMPMAIAYSLSGKKN